MDGTVPDGVAESHVDRRGRGVGRLRTPAVAQFTSRYTSLAAIVLMLVTPLAFLLTGQPIPYVLYTVAGGLLVLWRHRDNARALLAGTERKFGERVRKKRAR
jgi:glycerol-3-phosphate acyltransferase PlsY